jgi:hypothetical protein
VWHPPSPRATLAARALRKGVLVILAALGAALCVAVTARADSPADANVEANARIFDGAGVFIDNVGNFPGPVGLAETLQRDHFSWVAFHSHNGTWASYGINSDWVHVMRAHGLKVGLWGWEDASPWLAAQLAAFEVQVAGADFYIADAEWDYLRARHTANWLHSRIFAQTFRRFEPTLPAAMTTFGAAESPWVLPLDYASWRDNGFDLLPQAYFNQFPKVDRPDQTVAHAQRAGWPIARVHPVIGVYRRYPASKYVPLLQAAGTTGYSVYIGDQATAADYDALSVLNGG